MNDKFSVTFRNKIEKYYGRTAVHITIAILKILRDKIYKKVNSMFIENTITRKQATSGVNLG